MVLCLTMELEVPLKLATKNTVSEIRMLKQAPKVATTKFVATNMSTAVYKAAYKMNTTLSLIIHIFSFVATLISHSLSQWK